MSRRRCLLLLAATTVLVTACATPPLPHPLGPACTWPAQVNPDRDGLAVLVGVDDDGEATLLDVTTSTVIAQCRGVASFVPRAGYSDPRRYQDSFITGLTLPALSPDYRLAISSAGGVIELATGRVIPDPDPAWPAVAFAGSTRVLRHSPPPQRRVREENHLYPRDFCAAPQPDSPMTDCSPIPGGDQAGIPTITGDTIGWAPEDARPLTLTNPDGTQATGVTQASDQCLVNIRFDPIQRGEESITGATPLCATGSVLSKAMTPLFRQPDTGIGTRQDPYAAARRLSWINDFTVTDTGVTGTIVSAGISYADFDDLMSRNNRNAYIRSSTLVNGRAAAIVVVQLDSALDPPEQTEFAFVFVPLDGAPRVLAHLPLADAPDALLRVHPTIYAWPTGTTAPTT